LAELSENAEERAAMGERALDTLRAHRGATQRTLAALEKLLAAAPLQAQADAADQVSASHPANRSPEPRT
jgi:hypothetical protein